MASRGGLSGLAVAEIAAGVILAWSGITDASLSATLTSLLKGQKPRADTGNQPVVLPAALQLSLGENTIVPGITTGAGTGSQIANDALRYQGHGYLYGGAPGPAGTQPWDCSSFVNWVLGHDLGMVLPGASSPGYSGLSHGPTTLSYLTWGGAWTVGHTAAVAQAGDLCVWQTHMGIAIGGGQMISAQDPALGTGISQISLPEFLFVRRITGT